MLALLDAALDGLKSNVAMGTKIQKPLWPTFYVRRYGVTNLWKVNVSREARLVYTLLSVRGQWVVVLEVFFAHKEYEKRFGYR